MARWKDSQMSEHALYNSPMLEDIPIFYLASNLPYREHWWAYTGYEGAVHEKCSPHRVYFTESFLKAFAIGGDEVEGSLGFRLPSWEMVLKFQSCDWVVKSLSDGRVWVLKRADPATKEGYIIGEWPD